jgi:hypothetical protein
MGKKTKAKDPGWATCPECDKKVKTDNLSKHLRKIHGIKTAGIMATSRTTTPGPFPLYKFVAVIAVAAIIVFAGMYVVLRPQPSHPEPSFTVDPTSYDYGMMHVEKRTTNFTIFNYGDAALRVYNISTSCDCTQLTITYDNQTGPVLKKSSNPDYSVSIAPGRNARMTVSLDSSMFTQTGPIYRTIYMNTNDKAHKSVEITVTANVKGP